MKNTKHNILFAILIALLYLILPQSVQAAEYYLDAVNGNDTNSGISSLPWKTIAKAQSVVQSGDTVIIRTGNYGAFSENLTNNRTGWIIYKAAPGHTPVFTKIAITAASSKDAYLEFDGINIQHPNWTPASGDDGDYHASDAGAPGHFFEITNVNYVQLLNGKYEGYYQWISLCADITNANNVTIRHCEMTNFNGGAVDIRYCSNLLVDNCYIHKMVNGSGLRIQGTATDVVFQNNHLNYENTDTYAKSDPYFPHQHDESDPNWDGVTQSWLHNGSGICIRSSNITVRKNIVRGLFPQGLMFYANSGVTYQNMIVENNLFYDTGRVALYDCGDNIIVRNNNFIGLIRADGTGTYDILQRYGSGSYFGVASAVGYDGSGIKIYNNILIHVWGISSSSPMTEDYNLIWVFPSGGNYLQKSKGEHTFIAVWRNDATPYALRGYPNYFEDTGFKSSTPEYNYSVGGIQPFFVNPGFYFGTAGYYRDSGKIWDYHLADGSPGINFGDPNSQPSDSLGNLYSDGFIRNDGPARDVNHHSVGCYEYASEKAILYGDVSGDGAVSAYDAALTAQAAVGLITLTAEQAKAADVSGDGVISAYDAALIAQKAVGLVAKFPVETG